MLVVTARSCVVSRAPLLDYHFLFVLDIHDCGEFLFTLDVGPEGSSKSNRCSDKRVCKFTVTNLSRLISLS